MDQESDPTLVALAQAGDREAFAELYARYFDPVYDFVVRMTRDRDEAANLAQDTFLTAMNALGGLQEGTSFKVWIFTIARNAALDHMGRANGSRPLVFEDAEGQDAALYAIDGDRLPDPAEAARATAMAALVGQAAAGLDPKQLSLLDLHLRHGLDSGEIAGVMGVTKSNGQVMLSRLQKTIEDSIGAFIMLNDGQRHCGDLDSVLATAKIRGMSPEARRLVDGHVTQCTVCRERRKQLVAPLAVFGAFAMVGPPATAKTQILDLLMYEWPGPVGAGQHADHLQAAGRRVPEPFVRSGTVVAMFLGLGLVAGLLVMLLLVPSSPIALTRLDGDKFAPAGGDGSTSSGGDASPVAVVPTKTPTAASGRSSATAAPAQTAPGGSPTTGPGIASTTAAPATRTPTPAAGSPTVVPTATAASTPVTPTNTPLPSPSPTAPPCTAFLSAYPSFINALSGSTSFELLNNFCKTTGFTIANPNPGDAWLRAQPSSGALEAGAQRTIGITANVQSLGEGAHSGTLRINWAEGAFDVTVQVTREGVAPVITSVAGQCAGSTLAFSASVTDDFAVRAVTLQYKLTDGAAASAPMTLQGGLYQAQISGPILSYSVLATDFAGHSASSPLATCP